MRLVMPRDYDLMGRAWTGGREVGGFNGTVATDTFRPVPPAEHIEAMSEDVRFWARWSLLPGSAEATARSRTSLYSGGRSPITDLPPVSS